MGAIAEFVWAGAGASLSRSPLGGGARLCVFLQKARSGTTFGGECDLCPAVLTVPLTIFCKRHGRGRPLRSGFDRAFATFLQKARSGTTASLRFRPCLCHFFAKGTVGGDRFAPVLTVPLPLFCKRHGRGHPICSGFDRAFNVFLRKARSGTTASLRF